MNWRKSTTGIGVSGMNVQEVYEKQIVGGHPDIAAFEAFEEDFLEEVLRYLADKQERPIKLMVY